MGAWAVPRAHSGYPATVNISTMNATESLNARYRPSANACGHFPNEAAAQTALPDHARPLRPRPEAVDWTSHWEEAMNAFDGWLSAGERRISDSPRTEPCSKSAHT